MSTTTEDRTGRESPVDAAREGIPFNDLEAPPSELAAETPLTKEAAIHLRAAASEIDGPSIRARSMIQTVERALVEPMGGEKGFSEEERMDLAELLSAAQDELTEKVVFPVFERGRGERPHGDGPHLSLDTEKLDELVLRLTTAICVGLYDQADSEELRYARRRKMGKMVDDTIKWIEEQAGVDLYGDEMHDRASERVQEIVEELAAEVEDDGSEGGESYE